MYHLLLFRKRALNLKCQICANICISITYAVTRCVKVSLAQICIEISWKYLQVVLSTKDFVEKKLRVHAIYIFIVTPWKRYRRLHIVCSHDILHDILSKFATPLAKYVQFFAKNFKIWGTSWSFSKELSQQCKLISK